MNYRIKDGDVIAVSDANYFVYTNGVNSGVGSFFGSQMEPAINDDNKLSNAEYRSNNSDD